jgi:hypothetical protein
MAEDGLRRLADAVGDSKAQGAQQVGGSVGHAGAITMRGA